MGLDKQLTELCTPFRDSKDMYTFYLVYVVMAEIESKRSEGLLLKGK